MTIARAHQIALQRPILAQEAYDGYPFGDRELVETSPWRRAESVNAPDRAFVRDVSFRWEGRLYHRLFVVVFHPNSLAVEDFYLGDLLP